MMYIPQAARKAVQFGHYYSVGVVRAVAGLGAEGWFRDKSHCDTPKATIGDNSEPCQSNVVCDNEHKLWNGVEVDTFVSK